MSGHHCKTSKQMCSPFKTMLGKLRNRYQAYCTTYKRHTIAICNRDTRHPIDSDIDLHIEEAEGINTGLVIDNESNSSLDTTVAFGGPEAEGHPNELIPSNQAKLTALMREINDLHQ